MSDGSASEPVVRDGGAAGPGVTLEDVVLVHIGTAHGDGGFVLHALADNTLSDREILGETQRLTGEALFVFHNSVREKSS